jgi:peroxiredoxin
MTAVLVACRLGLAAVFAVAAVAKLADRPGTIAALTGFGVPRWLARPGAVALPLVELGVAGALLPRRTAWWGAAAALALLAAFIAAIAVNLARGRRPDCHCFGQIHSAPAGASTLARNGFFVAAAAFVVVRGSHDAGPSVLGAIADIGAGAWLGLAAFAALAIAGWLIITLLRQQGRLLLRIEALEARFEQGGLPSPDALPIGGLPAGAPAAEFDLPELGGGTVGLDRLLERGRPVLLVFSEPGCGPCAALLPLVARWQETYREQVTVAVISRGDRAENAEIVELGLRDVLLQTGREVAEAYDVAGTPAAVLIDRNGTVVSRVALGSNAIDGLMSQGVSDALRSNNGERRSREHAPSFRLPDLTGAFFEAADLRGTETLLLFWDANDEQCLRIVDRVRAREDAHPVSSRKLVLVSRGGVEANRALGLSSLILLDEAGEVTRTFGIARTPAAVLLDAETKLASSVGYGDAVLRLAELEAMPASSAEPAGSYASLPADRATPDA